MCKEPELSDKELYPTFARTYPGVKQLTPSLVALLKHFKWNKIALIIDENIFKDTAKNIKKKFSEEHIQISHEESLSFTEVKYHRKQGDSFFPITFRKIKEKARSKYANNFYTFM